MATSNFTAGSEITVRVNITPTVERDYERRNVFPSLRLKNTTLFINCTGIHSVSIEEAEEILKDARTQWKDRTLQRGTTKAFSSLIDRLTDEINHAKGLWDDPGIEVARQRMQESPAQFQVGETVRYYSPWIDDDDDGMKLTIVKGYGLYRVLTDDGEFVAREGGRVAYRLGYVVLMPDGKTSFHLPHELQRIDYKRGHLRLVETRPSSVIRAVCAQ